MYKKSRCSVVIVALFFCFNVFVEAEDNLVNKALVHFDASVQNSVEVDADGEIGWSCLNSIVVLRGNATKGLVSGLPAVSFDGKDDCLLLESGIDGQLRLGASHIFIVAKLAQKGQKQFVVSMGSGEPRFDIFSNGSQYMLEVGSRQYQKRCGTAIDSDIHLFEFSHVIPSELKSLTSRTKWPGDFYIDGKLCGKHFNAEELLPIEKLIIGADSNKQNALKGEVGEIVVFNETLSDEQIRVIRHQLARKWKVDLNEWQVPDDLPIVKEKRIGPPQKHSSFGYYAQTPESPDDSKIAYIVFDKPIGHNNTTEKYSVWLCDKDLTNHRKVFDSPEETTLHNGAVLHWVDNKLISLGSGDKGKIMIVNVDTGKVEFGPYSPGWPGGIAYGGKVLMHISKPSDLGDIGLYQLDTKNGEVKCLFTATDFADYYDKYQWAGKRDPSKWRFVHGKFSEKGSHIAFTVHTGSGGGQHLFTCKADGSDVRVWRGQEIDTGGDKPLHFLWYNDELLYGVDQCCNDGTANDILIKLWDRDGKYVKTIAGQGAHIGMSYDKKWFAADTFYFADPVRLYIYKTGSITPVAVVFEHKGIIPTWIDSGHVNPSFSRDSKRLYYTRPVGNNMVQAYCCDFTDIIK